MANTANAARLSRSLEVVELCMKGCKTQRFLGLAAVMLLAGCVETTPPPELRTSSPIQTEIPGSPPAGATRAALPPHKPATEGTPTTVPPATKGVEQLVGLNEEELQNVLGPPMLQEEKAPTKLWVFRSHNCTINVTLYPDVQTRQFHALSYEVISDVNTPERTRQCTAEFSSRFSQR
jgi:hypothetical protein